MRPLQFIVLWIILILTLLSPSLLAQDTTGFDDSTSVANTLNPMIEWRESWYSGQWYNLSFNDGFAFDYRFYGAGFRPPNEEPIHLSAFGAAMGNFTTNYLRPNFMLVGYVVEDSMWCILSSVLSPEYVHRRDINMGDLEGESYWVDEVWSSWRQEWLDEEPPEYRYDETEVRSRHECVGNAATPSRDRGVVGV